MKLLARCTPCGALILMAALLSGCAADVWTAEKEAHFGGAATPGGSVSPLDILQIGHRVTISISDIPDGPKIIEEVIGNDGMITLPYTQRVKAEGKTRRQVQDEIVAILKPAIYQRLTVQVKAEDRFFTVGGEVRSPSRLLYQGGMTVLTAITSVGGFTEFSDKSDVRLTRAGSSNKVWRVDANRAQKKPDLDPPVYPGDQIHVERRLY
ncbi:MAG: polysaccharide biosynthesis/export family protein [Verrucomicrobia bacterium]|nr:polysaccharide biosynthesis/export family protein [Verrucomicrobiota bacterium]